MSASGEQANEEVKNMFYQLYGDKNRYTQMVLNFLSNSVHYTKKGGSITINLVLLEEQVIKPAGSNATHSLVELEDLVMNKQMIGLDEGLDEG
jgi:signal transduction histidine kinase